MLTMLAAVSHAASALKIGATSQRSPRDSVGAATTARSTTSKPPSETRMITAEIAVRLANWV